MQKKKKKYTRLSFWHVTSTQNWENKMQFLEWGLPPNKGVKEKLQG